MAARIVTEVDEFKKLVTLAKNDAQKPITVVNFWASWCDPCKHMNNVFQQLAKSYPSHTFIQVEAETVDDLAEQFQVTSVPSFVFIKDGREIDRLNGAHAIDLAKKIEKHTATGTTKEPSKVDSAKLLNQRLEKLVRYAPVMLFMKGTPDAPQCGFSNKIVDILKKNKIPFSAFNILSDNDVRNGLKDFSNWKTYPQLYVNGDLVGGLDIVKEMDEEGELMPLVKPVLEAADPKAALNERLKNLINSSPVMLFMKGTPDEPKCGFSTQMVGILNNAGIQFGSFNILNDNTVRQALKEYSNWPTYPQLYVKGELIGGLDIVREMSEAGELKSII
mmetsp:Transcript_35478/g.60823  ORF Transcript_35478/g.60823 Transcript_35478/m.60823 type:complete len:333 (-) Transcript_35478:152-1150(-)